MKKNSIKLLTLFFVGCIFFGGCGEAEAGSDSVKTNTVSEDEETNEDTGSLTTDSDDLAFEESDASTDTSVSTLSDSAASNPENSETATTAPGTTAVTQDETGNTSSLLDGERHSVVGIITDATKYSVSIQISSGDCYSLTIPESGVTGNLNSIIVGQMATLTYVGTLDENHASLVDISNSNLVTGIYIEEYAFAIKIINAVKSMNMKELSLLTNFPVFIDTGSYKGPMNTSGEFEAIDSEKIFTEALVTRMVNYNLFDLKYTDAGFVMGNGTPSITFDVDDNGILGIIGINSAAPPAKDK